MRANRSTLIKLCLLTALAVPVQRAASAAEASIVQLGGVGNAQIVAQLEGTAPKVTTTDGSLIARTNESNLAIIEDADGKLVAGPLTAAGGAVTALAFSPDGQTLATGTDTGMVRYWDVDGTPQGELFDPGNGNAISELTFQENDKLLVSVANGNRQGLWGLNGQPYGEDAPIGANATADADNDVSLALWLWLIPLLGLLGAGLWWILGRNRQSETPEPKRQIAPTATVAPPVTDPEGDREVSNRAQTVIKTDRVTDESRTVRPTVEQPEERPKNRPENRPEDRPEDRLENQPMAPPISEASTTARGQTNLQANLNDPDLPEFESTDLENPELDDSNLDLRTAGLVGSAAIFGDADMLGGSFAGSSDIDSSDIDSLTGEDDDDEWDDNLDLTLDDPDAETSDVWADDTAAAIKTEAEPSGASNLNDIEPTRDMVIAETSDMPDIEPNSQTIIGDSTVIFGGAAADDSAAASALPEPAIAPISPSGSTISDESAVAGAGTGAATVEDASPEADIDRFFAASFDEPEVAPEITPESREDTLEAGLSPVLEESVLGLTVSDSTVPDSTVPDSTVLDSTVILGNAAAGIAGGMINTIPLRSETEQSGETEEDSTATTPPRSRSYTVEELASVDEDLPELPEGYGDSRIVLLPRDPKWAYAYWDITNEHKDELRRQGGQRLALRLYDVTEIDQTYQTPHGMQQQDCDEMARSWYLEIPVSDRDYTVEIGYLTGDGRWLMLARSAPIRVPPIYPSDWVSDQFVTIGFDNSLAGKTVGDLGRQPNLLDGDSAVEGLPPIYDELFAMTQGQNALRVAGSLFGSMSQMAPGALSPSGSLSGLNVSGLNVSGLNVSGLNRSGAGLNRQRNFWLVADAELIVYGATEPNATLMVGDRVVPLSPDGTFRFHVPFPDGKMEYPIRAIAVDGEQSRAITMEFERGTPERNTNRKEEA